jgi:hypothetical protein
MEQITTVIYSHSMVMTVVTLFYDRE